MPAIPGADLTLLRTYPQKSRLYLIVQQPQQQDANGDWTGYDWSCQIDGAPAGTEGDLVASLTVDNGDAGAVDLLDGQTIFIGTVRGDHDKGIFRVRTDQTVDGATVALDIGSSSEIVGTVEDDDWVVVLDEFRLWTRYPLITEAAGVLSWYKDYDVTWDSLGATDAQRRQASYPPVPIMGPHAVAFIPIGGSADVDFDWRDSYAQSSGAAVDDWDAWGEDGGAGWNVLNNSNPGEQTYSNVSGLAGYRVRMEVGSDVTDPPARFRRGIRYVFTLRRPGEAQAGDPANAEPITDFSLDSLSGSYSTGHWQGQITVFDSQASEIDILDGALVVLFADDWYGSTNISIAPRLGTTAELDDRENIVCIGRIADGSVQTDPDTGDVTFDIISAAGQSTQRDMYPIPIENDGSADEWYKAPDLTLDRAAWFYAVWHSTIPLICDWYSGDGTEEIKAMDFLAGNIYQLVDSFLRDRMFGRLLCDRFERFSCEQDRQLKAAASGATIYTLATADWLDQIETRDVIETPASIVEVGALNYDAGKVTPFMSRAPGDVNRDKGSSHKSMSLATADQATLNTYSGRWLAALNNRWPEFTISQGNWRIYDVWPQDYVIVSEATDRHTFSSDKFIPREIDFRYDPTSGALFVSTQMEMETDGVDGQTVVIPDDPPDWVPPPLPPYPPRDPRDPVYDPGTRIIGTDVGVAVCPNIWATIPYWYMVNSGLSGDALDVLDIGRDPFHWWTAGITSKTLWALTQDGLYQHTNFPYGTWAALVDRAALRAAIGDAALVVASGRLDMSAEEDGRCAFVFYSAHGIGTARVYACTYHTGALQTTVQLGINGNNSRDWPDIKWAQHSSGLTIYASYSYDDPFNPNRIYRSIDGGVVWAVVDTITNAWPQTGKRMSISVPYVDAANPDSYILWNTGQNNTTARISVNRAASFGDIAGTLGNYSKIGTGGHPDRIWLMTRDPGTDTCLWSNDRGTNWGALPLTPVAMDTLGGDSHVVWNGDILDKAIVGHGTTLALYAWRQGWSAWQDKTGNLSGFGVGGIRAIDRDSSGGA